MSDEKERCDNPATRHKKLLRCAANALRAANNFATDPYTEDLLRVTAARIEKALQEDPIAASEDHACKLETLTAENTELRCRLKFAWQKLGHIKQIMQAAASNTKSMQIARPALQVLEIIKR